MTDQVLTIDGSLGEGGGQVLRSSLALSLVTGRPFVMEKIRAGRKKPGLMRQHLTAVEAAAEIGQAEVTGAAIGSKQRSHRPLATAHSRARVPHNRRENRLGRKLFYRRRGKELARAG